MEKHFNKILGYVVSPIDHWDGWLRVVDAFESRYLPQSPTEKIWGKYPLEFRSNYLPDRDTLEGGFFSLFADCVHFAKDLGWEGDFQEGPFIFCRAHLDRRLDESQCLVVGWKQKNNGTTFLFSKTPIKNEYYYDTLRWLGGINTPLGQMMQRPENAKLYLTEDTPACLWDPFYPDILSKAQAKFHGEPHA